MTSRITSGETVKPVCRAKITGSEWYQKPHTFNLQMAVLALNLITAVDFYFICLFFFTTSLQEHSVTTPHLNSFSCSFFLKHCDLVNKNKRLRLRAVYHCKCKTKQNMLHHSSDTCQHNITTHFVSEWGDSQWAWKSSHCNVAPVVKPWLMNDV